MSEEIKNTNEETALPEMVEIVGINFREAGKIYYFSPGELKLAAGETYKGNWKSDKRDGADGELNYANGDRYSGPFINGLPDTRERDADGKLVVMDNGKYRHNEMGIYTYADSGRIYTGYFEEGKIVTVDGDLAETPES